MSVDLKTIRTQSITELVSQARSLGIDNAGNMRKSDLIFELICIATSRGKTIFGDGILEILGEGFGFLRSPVSAFGPGTDDIYVSPAQIRRFNLRTGDFIEGKARTPREGERYLALLQIEKVNGQGPEEARNRFLFETLALSPSEEMSFSDERLNHWAKKQDLRKGERVLIRHARGAFCARALLPFLKKHTGKVVYLSIETPTEEHHTLSSSELLSFVSPMGEGSARHLQVANLALMRCKRLAEQGDDVVLVFDSLWTYLLCAQEQVEQQGKQGALSVGCSMFRYFWGSARQLTRGSLSIYALLPDNFCDGIGKAESQFLHQTHHEVFLSLDLESAGCLPPFLNNKDAIDAIAEWNAFHSS
jgi:transcription termination factor Rho